MSLEKLSFTAKNTVNRIMVTIRKTLTGAVDLTVVAVDVKKIDYTIQMLNF